MRCQHCGEEHPETTIFCPTTGWKLVTAQFCSNCGAKIQSLWKVCPKCGVPVSESSRFASGRGQQVVRPKQSKTPRRFWIPVLFSILVLAVVTYLIFPSLGVSVDKQSAQASREINASEGGQLTLLEKTIVKVPPGSLKEDTQVSLQKTAIESAPVLQPEMVSAGSAYAIDLGNRPVEKPVILEIPFDPALLPDDATSDQVFLSYYDEDKKEWVFAGGQVDTSRNVIILETTHASWWMPITWNWKAWIAVLNKTLQFSIVNWIEAAKLLTESCLQAGNNIQVDSSQARNVVQGCIERDDSERPELRVVNPKSFFFEVQPVSGGNGYPEQTLLSPGEDLKFEAFTSDPAPLIIEANMTQKSGWYLIVHMVLTMLPGANQFGIQGKQVACITERLADVSYFADTVEALLVDQDGAAAAESLSKFMLDGDAVRRFITAADDCNFGPAQTWSVEGIGQIGGAVSTIMSATDYVANYLAGNSGAKIIFNWASLNSCAMNELAFVTTRDGNEEVYIMKSDGTRFLNLTRNSVNDGHPSWSPKGDKIAFHSNRSGDYEIYTMNTDGSGVIRLTNSPDWDGQPSWSPDGKYIAFESTRMGSFEVFVMRADGTQVENLTQGLSGGYPAWSPDGTRIAFQSSAQQGNREIYIMNYDGSNITRLTYTNSENWMATWSPDGKRIIFSSNRDGNWELYSMNPDGTGQTRLTNDTGDDWWPVSFSQDGTRLAFTSNRFGSWDIFLMNVDGTNLMRLTDDPGEDKWPVWRSCY